MNRNWFSNILVDEWKGFISQVAIDKSLQIFNRIRLDKFIDEDER